MIAALLLVALGSLASWPCRAEMSTADLQDFEENLKVLGFDPGPVDGQVDDETRAAIQRYFDFAFITGRNPEPTPALLAELKGVVAQLKTLQPESQDQGESEAATADGPSQTQSAGATSFPSDVLSDGKTGAGAAATAPSELAQPAIPNLPPEAAFGDAKLMEPAIPSETPPETPPEAPLETAAGSPPAEPATTVPAAGDVAGTSQPKMPVTDNAITAEATTAPGAAPDKAASADTAAEAATASSSTAASSAAAEAEGPPVAVPEPRATLPDVAQSEAPKPQVSPAPVAQPETQHAALKAAAPIAVSPAAQQTAGAAAPAGSGKAPQTVPQAAAVGEQVARLPAVKPAPAFSDKPADLYSRGMELYRLGDYESAIAFFSDALQRDPNFAAAYQLRGASYQATGQLALALEDFDTLIHLTPSSAAAYNNRCSVLARSHRLNEALKDCNQALSLNPYDSEALHNRAYVYEKSGQHDRARMDYARAYQLNPYNSEIASDAHRIGIQ